MTISSPTIRQSLQALLRADTITLWRNRRSMIIALVMPIVILASWKDVVKEIGGPFALSSCVTIGLIAIGLMGYSNTMARDREKGVFQRLRVTPTPTWIIMTSRLAVQTVLILIMTIIVMFAGYIIDKISLSMTGYIIACVMAVLSGALFLGLGQAVVGLVSSADTVNAVTRLIYFPLVLVGAFGELGVLGKTLQNYIIWSPYGVVKSVLMGAMQSSLWGQHAWWALLAIIGYAVGFSAIGIKWFKWQN